MQELEVDSNRRSVTMEEEDDEVVEMKKVGETRDRAWQLEVEAVQKQHAIDVEALATASQELQRVRQQLLMALESKKVARKEARDAKSLAEANEKRIMILSAELKSLKESMEVLQKSREHLDVEVNKQKDDGDFSLEKLKDELHKTKESESQTMHRLSESKSRVEALEVEVSKAKESEKRLSELLSSQTKQLEQNHHLLQETQIDIISLQNKIKSLEEESAQQDSTVKHVDDKDGDKDTNALLNATIETLKSELQIAQDAIAQAQDGEEAALSKIGSLNQETRVLRNELKLATEAEEKSKKAMDELALVLIEVTKETNEVREKHSSAKSELDGAKEEADHWKQMMKTSEDKFQALLEEERNEKERLKCLSERLKLEAEDSILAWNGKELEFVNCIKRAEEESSASKKENTRLIESLRLAEDVAKVLRDENCKLRDILKQALNESSVAKEAAELAREENSQLKDSLVDKDDMVQNLIRENERLRINEAASFETIKELKRMLSTTPSTPTDIMMKTDEDTADVEQVSSSKKPDSITTREHHRDHERKLTEILNLTLAELKLPKGQYKHKNGEDEDPEMTEMLKGSIFDVMDSPVGPKPVAHHRKMSSTVFTEDGRGVTLNFEEFEDGSHLDDTDADKSSQRKKKALYRRFGEMLRITSFHRREASVG